MDVEAEPDRPTAEGVDVAPEAEVAAEPVVPEQATSSPGEPPATPAPAFVPPKWQNRSTTTRVCYGIGRSVAAVAAVALLAVTGYNWSILHQLDKGIARTDVFGDARPQQQPVAAPPVLTSDVNILLVGMDSRTDPHGDPLPANELAMLHAGPDTGELDTDTMILVHIPAGGKQAVAFSFPRDSYVQIAGGYGRHRLNSAFAYAHNSEASHLRAQGMTNAAQIEQLADTAGRRNLIATIEDLIGNAVPINRYAEINLAGFYDLSLAVGGVQVCLNGPTHDDQTGASFPAGVQTIAGVRALNFVRERHGLPGGDLDRIARQQVFLGAVANKMLSTGTLTNLSRVNALTRAIEKSITLSSGWDVASFIQQMQGLSSGAIQFHTIRTGPDVTAGGADVLQVDPAEVHTFVAGLINDTDQAAATTTPLTPTTPASATSPTTTTTQPVATTATGSTTTTGPITAQGLRCVN
ncbi:MAG TPA: LCP family protein [Pseudonocardiaceae bacterium]